MGKKREIGEKWESTHRGIAYLMEKDADGVNRVIERLTPYVDKSKANTLSRIPATDGRKKPEKPVRLTNMFPINTNKAIKKGPVFNPDTHVKVRIDSKTEVWRLKTAI